jgi:hypothetical protein
MKLAARGLLIAVLVAGCASDPDHQQSKLLSQTRILTAEEIGAVPPHQKFLDQQKRYKELSSQPTPPQWAVGVQWRIEIDPLDGHSPSVIVFRITDIPETSTCQSGDWRRLDVVSASGVAPRAPAYSVQGRNLHILISTGLCDAYDEVSGELNPSGFDGWRESSGMFGSSRTGRVAGRALGVEE